MRRFSRLFMACAAALLSSAPAAEAQSIGFKVGASLSTLRVGGESEGQNTLTGLAGGGFIRFGVGRVGVQLEVLSVEKGAEFEGGVDAEDSEIRIDYLEVPVLLHVPLTYGASFAPYLFTGPVLSFDLGCEYSAPELDVDTDCDDAAVLGEAALERRSTDLGIAAGAGLAFALGPGALLLEGRYTWGLTDINENEGGDQFGIRNRAALLLASYSIPLR